jgi:alkanesulfonate monooxygenase
MSISFVSAVAYNPATVLEPDLGSGVSRSYLRRYVAALEDGGFDYALLGYASGAADPFTIAGAISQFSDTIRPTIALRPNTVYPTVAAKALATLDNLSDGRAVVHIISGGSTQDQAREGDLLDKQSRYARSEEYIRILRRIWSESGPIDHVGEYYQFHDFQTALRPVNGTIPVSFGGSSTSAYRVGSALADIYSLWAEPTTQTREQIDVIEDLSFQAGRARRPDIWVSLRPIIAATEDLAWKKAYSIHNQLSLRDGRTPGPDGITRLRISVENAGSQRLVELAAKGERFDRALWTPLVSAEGAGGASIAVVGTPETVAQQILDFVDIGVSIFAMRGYDNLNDVIDYGRYIIPLVRAEITTREQAGRAVDHSERVG